MSDLKLNFTGGSLDSTYSDIELVNGDLFILKDNMDIIEQSLRQKLRLFYGEWFLDQSKGLPYKGTIIGKGTQGTVLESLYVQTILSVVGVLKLLTFRLTSDTRTRVLSVYAEILTSSGKLIFNEALA